MNVIACDFLSHLYRNLFDSNNAEIAKLNLLDYLRSFRSVILASLIFIFEFFMLLIISVLRYLLSITSLTVER